MNCKPGDLAILLSPDKTSERWASGRIVRCLSTFMEDGHLCWRVEPRVGMHPGVCDAVLRPIGNPGDDATDETLNWLPVPTKEIA